MSESPEELTFKRGDVLTVLERDVNGLAGWWLCSVKGVRGIAPGNRLRILTGIPVGQNDGAEHDSDNKTLDEERSNACDPQWNRRSWHLQSDKVM